MKRSAVAVSAVVVTIALTATGCSGTADVGSGMDDTVRAVRDRVETVARTSSSPAELERRIRDGESYTLLLLDPTPDELRGTRPFPSTAITAVSRAGDQVEVELFTTGQGSRRAGWFGDEAVNAVGCVHLSARPGGRTTASGSRCGDAVQEVFRDPWVEVRLRP
ncbi:hypothetical protein BIU98_11850 [Curtobacterium sp. MMLR14_010]|uniref:hypothetical protein n=1 Tax=Curtobacterium sp. MMLR14_010 TaxID=1898743 RepID=UPI0008DE01E5|nr:hypothetical protein [Curtobacterium sp. MMLR14_010]OII39714.1 hypothetical protein BIU98_11850 [Curtobacterium sp. MMLR14_010]